jgi:hypothetical protein
MTTTLEVTLRAVLDALAHSTEPLAPTEATLVVQQYGDALRLGVALPMALRRRLHALSLETLRQISEDSQRDLGDPPAWVGDDDPGFAFALRQRDEIESVRVGLQRIALAHGLATNELDAIASLGDALERYDVGLAAVIDRGRAELTLGERMQLQAGDGWLVRLPHRDAPTVPVDIAQDPAWTPGSVTPEALAAWATRGTGASHVERWAEAPEHARELRSLLEGLTAVGAQVGLVPRRWLRRLESGSDEVTLAVRPLVALAAATHDEREQPLRRVELGELSPVRAVATLVARASDSTVIVRSEPGDVRRVQLGDEECEAPDERGRWTVRVAVPHGPIVLVVEGGHGQTFRCTLVIAPAVES